ncbi:MAG: protoheme IX farnesyltransferase [Acidobacteria bacterium]|nr:protoheme IX farnesyltransferase [Acidobacteriota bacterium]
MKDYLELTKPNVTWLILMSTAVGFYLGSPHPLGSWLLLLHACVGTALVASGTAALNQWMEREVDGKMRRTEKRPLPAGRLDPARAFWFGVALSVAGVVYLAAAVNGLTGFLGAFTCLTYLLCYTPLKKRTPHATLVGAFPGAMPILMGYAAATGRLTLEGWVLYGILFLWQFPHFLSIATLYREDYERGGIVMLPVVEPDGAATRRQIVGYTVALLVVSVLPTLLGLSGAVYFCGTLALGLAFLYFGLGVRTRLQARRLLQASVIYLPLVYTLMVLDKR